MAHPTAAAIAILPDIFIKRSLFGCAVNRFTICSSVVYLTVELTTGVADQSIVRHFYVVVLEGTEKLPILMFRYGLFCSVGGLCCAKLLLMPYENLNRFNFVFRP